MQLQKIKQVSMSICQFENNINNFIDIDCGCLICRKRICRCNHTYSLFKLLILVFSPFAVIFTGRFLLEKSYFNATTSSKVTNN